MPSAPPAPLDQGVISLKGVTPTRADQLGRLGIRTVGDLLFHFPRSYDDLTDVRGMDGLEAGTLQTVQGEVVEIEGKHLNDGRRVTTVVIADTKGKCVAGIWFNQLQVARQCRYGQRVAFSGKPKWRTDHWEMSHPRVQLLDGSGGEAMKEVVPVYPLTENLRPDQLRELIRQALARAAEHVVDVLPAALRTRRGYPPVTQALWAVHFPEAVADPPPQPIT